ncbi:MAG: carboxypeptidase-like regulatory domain-containing protein, partial [Acidobacteriota bacterium]
MALAASLATALFASRANAENVSGTVFDPAGSPLANASVVFSPQPFGVPVFAISGMTGVYNAVLAPGCWEMEVASSDFGTLYYPGTVLFSQQQSIVVASGQNITGLDFHYPPGHSMGGAFTASGSLPASLSVRLFSEQGEATTINEGFASSPWSLSYVPDGKYLALGDDTGFPRMYASRWFGNADAIGAATLIDFNANRSDINFNLQSMVTLTGHITRPGGGFGAGDRVYAYTRGGEYAPVGATTDASGNF